MLSLIPEFRQAVRGVAAARGFSALVVGVLGAGLACVLFMLAIINGLMLKPLPFADASRLLNAGFRQVGSPDDVRSVPGRDVLDWQKYLADTADVAAFTDGTVTLGDRDSVRRYSGAFFSAGLMPMLGAQPVLGRPFTSADDAADAPLTAIISHDVWQTAFAGAADIVGRPVRVNGQDATIIGVMDPEFSFPQRQKIWVPARIARDAPRRVAFTFSTMIKPHPGFDAAQVRARLEAWFADARKGDVEYFRELQPDVESFERSLVNTQSRAIIGVMLIAVVLVLLVAAANAANLLLTRTLGRRQELAVRAALGAGRGRLALHLVLESLILSLAALAIALPLALAGVRWLIASFAQTANSGPPTWMHFDLDARMIGFAALAALVTALVTGLLPALRAADAAVSTTLRDGSRSSTASGFARVSRALVIGEIALSCMLLATAGVTIGGIRAISQFDLGVDRDHMLTARVALLSDKYADDAERVRFFTRFVDALRAEPDVVDASVSTALPGWNGDQHPLLPEGAAPTDKVAPRVRFGAVDGHFIGAFGARLLQGRFLDERDNSDGPLTAVVDQTFADRYGKAEAVIGRRFVLDPGESGARTFTVVGVTAALHLDGIDNPVMPSVLVPFAKAPDKYVSIGVRTKDNPAAFAPRLSAVLRGLDQDTPAYFVRTYGEVFLESSFGDHVLAELFTAFGIVALVLASAGLYGVVAYAVGQRTREIGIRRALGAPDSSVLRSVFGRNAVFVLLGLVIGMGLGVPFSGMLADTLIGPISDAMRSQPLVWISVPVVLAAIAMLAAFVPARRALRIDPMVALREQ
jgi:putative ABC transport system permease protein